MKVLNTPQAPGAIGPYVQAIRAGDFVYVSGQLPLDPKTMAFAGDDIKTQTKQSLTNIEHILKSEGLSLKNVCKATILLDDINDFNAMNEVYATFFSDHKPARSAFEVGKLPKNSKIEIEVIAYCG